MGRGTAKKSPPGSANDEKRLQIAKGESKKATIWVNQDTSWGGLCAALSVTTRTEEAQADYFLMEKEEQDDIKDIGGFVMGYCKDGHRGKSDIISRSAVVLDADYAILPDTIDRAKATELELFVYSTHKHTPEAPRLRLIFPACRDMMPEEYEPISRKLAEEIGLEYFDKTTHEVNRLMFWPSSSCDAEYIGERFQGRLLDPDEWLAKYDDWHDASSWPRGESEPEPRRQGSAKAENPLEKQNIVGDFCRAHDIYDAIARWVPEYERVTYGDGDRYTYTPGHTAGGVVVYDGLWTYSHHDTDPASQQHCNAFDLVRIHKFGELDKGIPPDTPANMLPSYKAMEAFAMADPETAAHTAARKQADALEIFADSIEEDSGCGLETGKRFKLFDIMSNIPQKEPEWFIDKWLPKGQIITLGGDGGTGKTALWCNMAAAISSGNRCIFDGGSAGAEFREPALVMICSAEDSVETVLHERLRRAGAYMENIVAMHLEADESGEQAKQFKFGSDYLRSVVRHYKPALAIFDPIEGFIPSAVQMGQRNQMREVMSPFISLGAETGTTFLLIAHSNKKEKVWGRNRLADSSDIWDVSRSVIMCGSDGDGGFYAAHEKCNYGRLQDSILYSITEEGQVQYCGRSPKHDQDFVTGKREGGKKREETASRIITLLRNAGGEMPSKQLDTMMKDEGHGGTFNRAKDELKKAGTIGYRRGADGKYITYLNKNLLDFCDDSASEDDSWQD